MANCGMRLRPDEVARYPILTEWVINQVFEIDHYQPLLFVVEIRLGIYSIWWTSWNAGCAIGDSTMCFSRVRPRIDEADLRSFLEAANS